MMMTEEHSSMAMNSISFAMDKISYPWTNAAVSMEEYILEKKRPSILIRPQVYPDGDQWCALYGENLQDGVCGFGDTPDEACRAFDKEWVEGALTQNENSRGNDDGKY